MYNENAIASGITRAGVYDSGVGEGGSEVVAFDADRGLLYVTNGAADRIDVVDATSFTLTDSLDLSGIANYRGINSVAYGNGFVAAAVDLEDDTSGASPVPRNGVVAIFDADDLAAAPTLVETGNHPDMLVFSSDGTKLFVANEGEADEDYATQPEGGVTVIDLTATPPVATTVGFGDFDAQAAALQAAGVRIFPGEMPSTDFEAEYIAESADGTTLFVTLQEANAVAVFDVASMEFTGIQTLGTSDHSLPGFELDASDRDDAINIRQWPVQGLRMADAIVSFDFGGSTYYATANEGDSRDFDEARIADITLDPTAFPNATQLQKDKNLGRLNISNIDGDIDDDGDFDALFAYGSRSFTIFAEDGTVVFDSGSIFEKTVAALRVPNAFNNDDFPSDDDDVIDENRSDNKGPEPEAIAVGEVEGVTFIFVALERDSGLMAFRVDDPTAPELAAYIESAVQGDVSPEVIQVIDAADSATGNTQLAVSYEVSGTTSVIDLGARVNARVATRDGDMTGSLVDDVISGRNGDNSLWGGGSADVLRGAGGDDVLTGGLGDDRLVGGAGADSFRFDSIDGNDRIVDFTEEDVIDLTQIGIGLGDLVIRNLDSERTVVRYQDDLRIVVKHSDGLVIDADDFLF